MLRLASGIIGALDFQTQDVRREPALNSIAQ